MKITIPSGKVLWPHEKHTIGILFGAGYDIEVVKETGYRTADIKLNGIEYEIKSPETNKTSSLEQLIRKALKQSPNIIIDVYRMKMRDDVARKYLIKKCREQKQIKRMIYISKKGEIIDILKHVWYNISIEASQGAVCT